MNAKELLAELKELRGDYVVSTCECCYGSKEWEPDAKYGDAIRWEDVERLLESLVDE